ncbi:MAG: YigZ family protein [Lachnospiraceae bacterium]|nr:YigZ family protein [Lachnospiraceae bacterium]
MVENYKCLYLGGEGEIVEKKSRFIATLQPVESEEEAMAFLEKMKKKYWDARHNCSAYVIGEKGELERCSDDGEPNGTAGKPMLEVLRGLELRNAAVVVTRYFGGTLLGTGGLVRAYTQAVKAGIENSVVVEKILAVKLNIGIDYNGVGKIQYILGQRQIQILESDYGERVKITALVPLFMVDIVQKEITEGTNGRAVLEQGPQIYFGMADKEIVLFDH